MDDLYARLPAARRPQILADGRMPLWISGVFGFGLWFILGRLFGFAQMRLSALEGGLLLWALPACMLAIARVPYFLTWLGVHLQNRWWKATPSTVERFTAWGSLLCITCIFGAAWMTQASVADYGGAIVLQLAIAAVVFALLRNLQKKSDATATGIAAVIAAAVAFVMWPHVLLSVVFSAKFPLDAGIIAVIAAAASLRERDAAGESTAAVTQSAHLAMGQATGEFAERHAGQACWPGQILALDIANACRGVVVVGPQGSGKTSGVFTPALDQALRQGWSALIFAVKSDVEHKVRELAAKYGRACHIIAPGDGYERLNLLDGLSPEAAAAAIGDRLGDPKDPYWKTAPVALVQSWLQILYGVNGETCELPSMQSKGEQIAMVSRRLSLTYSLDALREVIYLDGDELRDVLLVADEVACALADSAESADRERLNHLSEGLRYFTGEYFKTFVKPSNGAQMLASIRASLLPHLRALTGDRAIRAAFAGETDVDLAEALANGEAVCVYVDDSQYPMAFANVMTFIFRRFADIAQSRLSANVTPCLLSADEYGSFATADHIAPLSRARQAKFIPIMGFQSLSQLSTIMGEHAAKGVVGAFASLVACGAADPATADYIRNRVGQTTIREEMQSHTNSGGWGGSSSTTTSTQIRQEWLADGHTLATLGPTGKGFVRALAVVAQGAGGELRDVVNLPQL